MKAILAVFVLSVPLLAQSHNPYTPACGDLNASMVVELDGSPQGPVAPQPDKALVYFIQDIGQISDLGYPTTRIGMDGKWIGANKKNSYFSFLVAPGEHHLCVAVQSSFVHHQIELSHFTAEAGKVYYFRSRISWGKENAVYLRVEPVDSDQAEYLIETFPLAKSHPRK